MESHINTYKLNQGIKEYILTISTVGDAIKITCKNSSNPSINFSREFTIDELKRLDSSFNSIRNQQEALDYLDNALKVQKVGVSEEGDTVKINFYVISEGENKNLEVPLGGQQSQYIQTTNTTTTTTTYDMNQNGAFNEPTPYYGETVKDGNQYLSEFNTIDTTNAYNTNINTGFDTNQYTGTYDTTNAYTTSTDNTADYLQNIDYSNTYQQNVDNQYIDQFTDTPAQYVGGDYQNINTQNTDTTGQYTTGEYQNYTTEQYTTGIEDLNSQFSNLGIQDTTPKYTTDYIDTTNNYNLNDTAPYNNQYMQTYQTTTQTIETRNLFNQPEETFDAFDVKPYIAPADNTNEGSNLTSYQKTTTTTTTTNLNNTEQNVPDERINRIAGDTKNLRNDQQLLQDKINALMGEMNTYRTKLELMEKEKNVNEVNALRAENKAIKQQLSELNNLRNDAAEVRVLRSQLKELDPLRKKAAEMDALKAQLSELQSLRAKVAELNAAKSQLGELGRLRAQVGQMNAIKQQLGELNSLRAKVAELSNVKSQLGELDTLRAQASQINILKKQIEELSKLKVNTEDDNILRRKMNELENIKFQYEQELRNLRDASSRTQTLDHNKLVEFQRMSETRLKNTGLESKQLFFEDKPQQICVKGDIIHNTDELELVTRKINKLNQKLTLNLLYKATADSDKASAFHSKCDEAKSTLVLVETDKGKRFGGYTSCSWSGDCVDKKDEDAFVFSLDKMQVYENIPGEDAIGCYPKFGPIFLGCQIRIYDNAFSKGGTTFEKGLNFNTEEDFELTGGERAFNVREIEVYEVIAQ